MIMYMSFANIYYCTDYVFSPVQKVCCLAVHRPDKKIDKKEIVMDGWAIFNLLIS